MRRTKADAKMTRQRIVVAAFDTFLEQGFDDSSLEQICRNAGVTRGAAYWHFKNKQDLYAQTVSYVLVQFDLVRRKIVETEELDARGKLLELLWYPTRVERAFRFIGQTVAHVKRCSGFEDIASEIECDEMRLYWFFLTEVSKLNDQDVPAEHTAMLLYIFFLGMYGYPIESSARNISKDIVESFVNTMIKQ